MGDIRAGLEELKLDGALFANVKYYVSGEGDPKVCYNFDICIYCSIDTNPFNLNISIYLAQQ